MLNNTVSKLSEYRLLAKNFKEDDFKDDALKLMFILITKENINPALDEKDNEVFNNEI